MTDIDTDADIDTETETATVTATAPKTPTPVTLLGTGAMGTALARAWLGAGHPVTVWNRTAARAAPLAAKGATVAASAAEAVAAGRLVIVCLLDDASVGDALDGTDLAGRDLVDLTTGTPGDARSRAVWAERRGARFLDGGIMAVPPMIGDPSSGGYVLYSGSAELFEEHRETLAVAGGTTYVGADPGFAGLYDIALLSGLDGVFTGVLHAFAMLRREDIAPTAFAPLLVDWLAAMAPLAHEVAGQLESGDYRTGVTSNLAMMVTGTRTMRRAAKEQGVTTELFTPIWRLMELRLAQGHPDEGSAGVVDLLLT